MSQAPLEPLYDAVALGMWAYTRSAFRVQTLGKLEPRPGTILFCAHRAETDVPVICPSIYGRARYLRDRSCERIHFAARDDMFERGFFAGFPAGLSPAARRLLYPLRAGALLPRVRVHPVPYPSAAALRLGRALERLPPATPLEEVLPEHLVESFRERARACGRTEPATAADVLRGTYADLLWRFCDRDQLASPLLEPVWRRRNGEGTVALRRLVELVRSGRILLMFPEGWPSPDGALSAFQPGLATLVRLGRPPALQPVGISYDRLTPGRPRAVVAFGTPFETPSGDVERTMHAALARTMPVTCGPVVAAELARAVRDGRLSIQGGELEAALRTAAGEGRPVDAVLASPAGRRSRLAECLHRLAGDGLLEHRGRGRLVLATERIRTNGPLAYAARERESVRAAL